MFVEYLFELWPWLSLSFVILFVFLYHIWERFFGLQGLPKHLPWAGAGYKARRRGRASLKSLLGLRELLEDGYKKYSKNGKAFILPNIVTGHEVILPMSQMQWLLNQPDHVLSQHEANKQFLGAEYTMLHPSIIGETRMATFIKQYLTRDLDCFAGDILDEIESALEDTWGCNSSQWHEINLYNVMLTVIGRTVNRVLVGYPLCRNSSYLHSSTKFAQIAPVSGGIISFIPKWLRPILGPLVTAYDTIQYWTISRMIEPLVWQRIFAPASKHKKQIYSPPNDFIQWALIEAFSHNEHGPQVPKMISKRLAVLGFAAIQSSALTITNALFDIAASSESISIQQALRSESEETIKRSGDKKWTSQSLAAMTSIDSVLRESLRLWSFVSHGVTKTVIAPDGVTLPSGEHLPKGAKCGIASYGPHHDENVYENPYTFDPFRFCRNKEDIRQPREHLFQQVIISWGSVMVDMLGKIVSDFSLNVLSSMLTKYSPGRFFAAQQLKILLAVISLRYDIEPISRRPENKWLNNTISPDIWAPLKVRRRISQTTNNSSIGQLISGPNLISQDLTPSEKLQIPGSDLSILAGECEKVMQLQKPILFA